tara:strand:- start:329 stop:778 length:450 start_codon:yes stop_codon:yes gene_type:complete
MDSVLSIVCIIFFALLTHYYIKGYNTLRHHKYNCKTLYIPEDFDVETALETVTGATRDELKKRALTLGAEQSFVDNESEIEIKKYIIQTSIDDSHIMTEGIEDKIKKREKDRSKTRQLSVGDTFKINKQQVPQLNPNVTINDLLKDFSE